MLRDSNAFIIVRGRDPGLAVAAEGVRTRPR
jgi:hypothetical protein